jgi:hypothetical protein
MDASDLDVELVSDSLEICHFGSELRQLDVDRCSQGSSEVGWAGSDVTETFIVSESSDRLNLSGGCSKSRENSSNISTLLHRNNSQLIFFINPNEEGLLVVMEDTSSFRPVPVESTSLKESVTLFKEEVISNQLLLLSFSHRAKRIESASKFALKRVAGLNNFLFDLISLLLCNSWPKRILS